MKNLSISALVDRYGENLSENYKFKTVRVKTTVWVWRIVRLVIMSGLSFILLYPLLYMLSMSFRPITQVMDPTIIWIPKSLTLENLRFVFDRMKYPQALWVTFNISIISALIQVSTTCLTGYGFARFNFPFKRVLFAILLFTIIVPPQTILIPLYLMNAYFDFIWVGGALMSAINAITGTDLPESINVLGTNWSFYLPAIFANGIRSGLLIYIFRQFFVNMPKELEEAAYIDGAGPLRGFITVMLPNAKPALITVTLFSVVWYWNDYFYAGIMLQDLNSTVSVRLSMLGSMLTNVAQMTISPIALGVYLQVGSFLTIAPLLVFYLIFQRHFTESVERSGIVG